MSKLLAHTNEPDIYAVGFLRDFKMWRSGQRSLRTTFGWFKRSWKRKSYWNGYLAETEDKPKCGKGWTKSAAYRSWERIPSLNQNGVDVDE